MTTTSRQSSENKETAVTEGFYRRAWPRGDLPPPATRSHSAPTSSGALMPPGELGRAVSHSEDAEDKQLPGSKLQRTVHPRTLLAQQQYRESIARSQRAEHAAAVQWEQQHRNNKKSSDPDDYYSMVTSLSYQGMEVIFATSTIHFVGGSRPVCYGMCARTHLVFQELTLSSDLPVVSLVSSPETGQIVIVQANGKLQTYLPQPTDPREYSFGKFRWWDGPFFSCCQIFYPISSGQVRFAPLYAGQEETAGPIEVSLSHNYKVLVSHHDQLAVLDVSPPPQNQGDSFDENENLAIISSEVPAQLLWTTRLPGQVEMAKVSGNGCSIALVLQRNDDDESEDADGVHTFERDWEDGSLHSADGAGTLPRPGLVEQSSLVGIVYKPGPFLVHASPVTRLAFRGLGHKTSQYTDHHEEIVRLFEEANDLLLTHCASDGVARIFAQQDWKPLTEWTTPANTRVDWVRGIAAFTLGDLEGPKTTSSKRQGPMRRNDEESDDDATGNAVNEMLGRRNQLHSIPSHTTPYSSAGAWISEITLQGPVTAVRLSRLTYLKRGMDVASPTLFESVSSILPPGSFFREGVLDTDESGVCVEGIWPAWNPWLSEAVKIDTNETLRGSAMSFLGLSPGPTAQGGGNFGDSLLGWTQSPPCELRFTVSHPRNGRITVLDARLFGDKSSLELEVARKSRFSLSDMHCFSRSTDEVVSSKLSASIQLESSRLVAQVAKDERSFDVVWRRPGTSSLLPSTRMPDDVERIGDLLAKTTVFRDESLLPVPLTMPPLALPRDVHKQDTISELLWWQADCYDGPCLLVVFTNAGSIVVYEVPPPSSFVETSTPNYDALTESIFSDDAISVSSDQKGKRKQVRHEYEVNITPDLDHGLGLRLESQIDGTCAIAGSYKKHPLTGEMLPAEKCGLVTLGDELVSVNGVNLEQKSFDEIIATVREVGAASGPGAPMNLRFRPMQRFLRENSVVSASSRRSMEQILGVAPEDADGEVIDPSDLSRASSQAPLDDLALNFGLAATANMVVGVFADAVPSRVSNGMNDESRVVLIPLCTSITLNNGDHRQRNALLAYLEGSDLCMSIISIPGNCDSRGARFRKVESFSLCSKNSKLCCLSVFEWTPKGCHLAATDDTGNVIVGQVSVADGRNIPKVSFRSFVAFQLPQPDVTLLGFSPMLLATMTKNDRNSVTVWSGLPQPGSAENGTDNEFIAAEVLLDDAASGNRIVDFCFMPSGFLDQMPPLVIFSLRGATMYTKPAGTREWSAAVQIKYGGIDRSDRRRQESLSFSLPGVDCVEAFVAFPHLGSSLCSVYNSPDENTFLRSDWHPETMFANVCTDEKGASEALQQQIRRTFLWLYSEGKDIPEDHLEGPLTCAPLDEIYVKADPVQDDSTIPENGLYVCGENGEHRTDDDIRKVQELLRRRFTDEAVSQTKTSFRHTLAMQSSGGAVLDLPFVLRSLSTEDARLMWAMGELVVDPPVFRSLDFCGQHFLFVASLLRKTDLTVIGQSKKENRTTHEPPSMIVKKQKQSMMNRTEERHMQIASSGCLSALLSNNQGILLERCRQPGEKFDWDRVRELRVAFWLRSDLELAKLSEEVGQNIFRNERDIMECALFFIIARKMRTLRNLAATDHSESGKKFFNFLTSHDFSTDRGRRAAEKNAFSLLRKCRYRVAAAFFLLASPPSVKSAVETIVSQLQDFDLAFFVMRLMTSPDLENHALSGTGLASPGSGGVFGGGGGYAAGGYEDTICDQSTLFSEWKPELGVAAKNLLVDRIMPMTADDTVMTSAALLWLNKHEEAAWCLSNTLRISFDKTARCSPLNHATNVAFGSGAEDVTSSTTGNHPARMANRFINFVSGPILLKSLGATARPVFAASFTVCSALAARGIEVPAIRTLIEYSDSSQTESRQRDEADTDRARAMALPTGFSKEPSRGNGVVRNTEAAKASAAEMQSSIFDSYNAPEPSASMQSSIFDSFDTSKAATKRNQQAGSTPAGQMQSSIFDDFDVPKPSARMKSAIGAPNQPRPQIQTTPASSGEMQSSIFDAFETPTPLATNQQPLDVSSGQMQSSIFDAFDTPQPVRTKELPAADSSGAMRSSIFDSYSVPASANQSSRDSINSSESKTLSRYPGKVQEVEKEFSVCIEPRQMPMLWGQWKAELTGYVAARRLVREIARLSAQFHGDPPETPIKNFYDLDLFVPPGASSVLQLPCDGPAFFDSVKKVLKNLSLRCGVEMDLIVSHALRILDTSNKHRLLFVVVLHSIVGRDDLAEKALRSASKSTIQRSMIFAFNNDGVKHNRLTLSHASTQFVRREVARSSWQLESSLWLHRGGSVPLSGLAMKEAICAVRIGLLIASWNKSFECMRGLTEAEPDCPTDDDAGRYIWSSLKVVKQEHRDVLPKSAAGGGWEFLVDCKRSQATEMLRDKPTGCFIIRPHSHDPGVFTLSFKTNLVPTNDADKDVEDRTPETSGDELSDLEVSKQATRPATRSVRKSDVVQHAIVRLSESGFRCGSFGPYTSLISLLEAVSSSLPFKLRFDKPPTSNVGQDEGSKPSPNAVLLRKLALRHADSLTSNPPVDELADFETSGSENCELGDTKPQRTFPPEQKKSFALFVELLVLTLIRRQLSGVVSVSYDEIQLSKTRDDECTDEETDEIVEIFSNANGGGNESQLVEATRIMGPFLTWCKSIEVRTVPELAPELAFLWTAHSHSSVDVTESVDAIEVSAYAEQGKSKGNGGDAILRRLIQQGSGIEFTTLRLMDGGECTIVLLFNRKDALAWLVKNGLEQSEQSAEMRLQQMQNERFIEPVDLSRLPLKQKSTDLEQEGVRYRFVDPWEVEALHSREGETQSASLGRSILLSFSLGKVALASESLLRSMGGLQLLELWTSMKGDVTLTKALASVHPPWERAAGGDFIDSDDDPNESSPFLNSIRQNLYRNALFRRLDLPQRFVSLIQVELLDLKNLTSPGGSLALTVYALLRLKRGGSGAPLTNKARTLDSAATNPVKLSKSSGPNAPASWGSVVRFRFALPDDVSVDGTSPDKDREILFRGPPTVLQLSVYEKKLLVDHSLGAADVSMDGLWAGGQLEEWVPLRSEKHSITWFARIRLTLRFELMCLMTGGEKKDLANIAPSVGLRRIEELSLMGGAHEDMEKRTMSSPDLLSYFESMVS